jgi:hypothetical protein
MDLSFPKQYFDGKRVVAYGAGTALGQIKAVMDLPVEYIVDDTPGLAGKDVMGVPVYSPSRLLADNRDDRLVVICANTPRAILAISRALDAMGLAWGKDYIDCSELNFETMRIRMHDALGIRACKQLFRRIKLLSLYNSIQSYSTIAGTWLFVELLEQLRCSGSIAECGVYNGGNAFISLLCSGQAAERKYHLLDSFEGFPELSQHDPSSRQGEFQDVSFARIREVFRNFENVEIHKGFFTNTLPGLTGEQFAAVYVDCDIYEPTLELCEFFYPRLPEGGFILFHDYWVSEDISPLHPAPFRGVNRAVNEFLGSDHQKLVVFPETTHAVLVK